MSGTSGFDRIRFALPMLATMLLFFAAAKFLPPIETHAVSAAPAVGFTNQPYPLVAILLLGVLVMGVLVMGALGLRRGAELPLRIGGSPPVQTWGWHLAAAVRSPPRAVSQFARDWARPCGER